jgi:hypothetical protein
VVKTAIITLVTCVVLSVGGIVAYSAFAPPAKKTLKARQDGRPHKKLWNGAATHELDTTFIRRGQPVTVSEIRFTGLNTDTSDADIIIDVHLDSNGNLPSWIGQSTFSAVSEPDNRHYTPQSGFVKQGDQAVITVALKGIPTDHLGPTCHNPNGPDNKLELDINAPGGAFGVGVNAPEL